MSDSTDPHAARNRSLTWGLTIVRTHEPAAILSREKKGLYTRFSSVCCQAMKVWSWYLVILAAITALALSSCALSQEGVAPNPKELPENNPTITPGGPG
jgi:hypothetical protein